MADFDKAFQKTAAHEGGYVFDPDDAGGETYKGISRRFHPTWNGWEVIDRIKMYTDTNIHFSETLDVNDKLQESVRQFYRDYFWGRFQGDNIPDQSIAEELFDTAVNMGVHRAVTFLQESLNLLNRNQKNYPDITEDGNFGLNTLKTLNTYIRLEGNDCRHLLKLMNALQGMHYIDYMKAHPKQEKYARGWLKRVSINKEVHHGAV